MTEYDIFDVFDIAIGKGIGECSEAAQGLAPEHLVYSIAVTINIPPKDKNYKKLELMEKVNVYKEIFNNICIEYNVERSHYQIEYCKSGEPHLHGQLQVRLHPNTVNYEDKEILRMVAKSIFLKLPKCAYKQFANAKINEYFNIFDTPAVYLKMPKVLSEGWTDYCNKNARPNPEK